MPVVSEAVWFMEVIIGTFLLMLGYRFKKKINRYVCVFI